MRRNDKYCPCSILKDSTDLLPVPKPYNIAWPPLLAEAVAEQHIIEIVTGSNACFLYKDVITEFRGRGDEVHRHPLSFTEFMSVYSGAKQDGWNEYRLYGGLPPIMNISSQEEKINFLKSLLEETCISDIVGRHNVRNRAELEELLDILSSAIGSLTNSTKCRLPSKLSSGKTSVTQPSSWYLSDFCIVPVNEKYYSVSVDIVPIIGYTAV